MLIIIIGCCLSFARSVALSFAWSVATNNIDVARHHHLNRVRLGLLDTRSKPFLSNLRCQVPLSSTIAATRGLYLLTKKRGRTMLSNISIYSGTVQVCASQCWLGFCESYLLLSAPHQDRHQCLSQATPGTWQSPLIRLYSFSFSNCACQDFSRLRFPTALGALTQAG
jgi:hypothetical protein